MERGELLRLCPSHDSLEDGSEAGSGMACFALGSGRFAVLRAVPDGPEPSGRGGLRVRSDLVLLEPSQLTLLANHPPRIAAGLPVSALDEQAVGRAQRLSTISLRADPCGIEVAAPGRGALVAALCRLVMAPEPVVAVLGCPGVNAFCLALDALPATLRPVFGSSVGFRFAAARDRGLTLLEHDDPSARRVTAGSGMRWVDLSTGDPEKGLAGEASTAWLGAVASVVDAGRESVLASWTAGPLAPARPVDLEACALPVAAWLAGDEAQLRQLSEAGGSVAAAFAASLIDANESPAV